MSKELLRRSPLFAGLAEEDLDRLYSSARRITLAPGDVLVAEGEAAGTAYLAIVGTFEVTRRSGDREFVIDQRAAGELMGEMALLENGLRSASVRAASSAELLEFTRDTFQSLLAKTPGAALAVLQTVAGRLRHSEVMLRHNEKMVALGTISAGLAHELNNPAAAVQRSATQLQEAIAALQRFTVELGSEGLSSEQTAQVERILGALPARLSSADTRSALERADEESALQEWLESINVSASWEIAPSLVTAGLSVDDLETLPGGFSPRQQAAFARSLASAVAVHTLLGELRQGSGRISEIVAAIKSYAYLDRGPVQLVDIHEGLEDTLVILRHKLDPAVEVVREYGHDLPRIEAYGGELNQVWTGILDNAVDAMNGHGVIRLRTSAVRDARGAESVAVEISDTGPGIPPAIHQRIFEPFFTTKEPGHGTGLGLHVAYHTVVNRHRGQLAVTSEPGKTTFTVTLPLHITEE